jgi:two-component system phosphate regulon sensor histidine kinase PhoR
VIDPLAELAAGSALWLGAALVLVFLLGVWLWERHRSRRALGGILNVLRELLAADDTPAERRADPTVAGVVGQLARAANQLAGLQYERQLAAAQDHEHLEALLQHISDAVVLIGPDERIVRCNPAAEKLLERPAASLLGQTLPALLIHRDLLEHYRAARQARAACAAEFRITGPRRTAHWQVTASGLYTGSIFRGTLLFIRDLSDINAASQMKTDFAANASHELRTPLASIRAAVETIQESWPELADDPRGPAGDMVKRCVEIIGGHVLRLQSMVQDLLDLSRTEEPRGVVRTDRVDLSHVAEMVAAMYAGVAAEKHVALKIELAPEARNLRGDERLLTLTLKNLVDNSLKFTPAGGQVIVRSQLRPVAAVPDRPADRSAPHPAMQLLVEVADTGCGIPPEDQTRVFERFYTVNRSRGGADRGTGLGLAIVKHAVAAMGGTVTLESELNRGTTVTCWFPVRHGETMAVL